MKQEKNDAPCEPAMKISGLDPSEAMRALLCTIPPNASAKRLANEDNKQGNVEDFQSRHSLRLQ